MLSDKDIVTDCLVSQKKMAHDYLMAVDHTSNSTLLQTLMNICTDQQQMRLQIFQAMHQRGWYSPQLIDESQISKARQQFGQLQQQLQQSRQQVPQPTYQQSSGWQYQQPAPSQSGWQQQGQQGYQPLNQGQSSQGNFQV